jgi:hypothetical protein
MNAIKQTSKTKNWSILFIAFLPESMEHCELAGLLTSLANSAFPNKQWLKAVALK